jgi:hypothetical protein
LAPRLSSCLLSVLLGSRVFLVLMWMMLEKVFGVGVVRRRLYMATKPSPVRDDVDGLSYPLDHPIACGCRPRVQSFWFETVLPYLVTKPFLREPLPQRAYMLRPSGWGLEPLDWHRLVLITICEMVSDSHRLFPGVRDPRGGSPCPGGEGLSPRVL